MKLKEGMFAVKLYELEQQYGRMQSRLQICQQDDHKKIRQELQKAADEYKENELLLKSNVESSRSLAVAALAEAQLKYSQRVKNILEEEMPEYLYSETGTKEGKMAEAAGLYAEYAIDFAVQSMKYALMAALKAIDRHRMERAHENGCCGRRGSAGERLREAGKTVTLRKGDINRMLELKNIKKDYFAGNEKVEALRGIDLQFRKCELVSILGPSGCGKTTLLNIIGGLDQYTSGDLIINGTSTKTYKDRDWDAYRNHSVGFVFQSYNLIPHQTVLENVELALKLSGVSKGECRRRAKEALKKVGLDTQMKKKPGEMSGGQMQRVAIARAIVNDPDIILADEPTGALDTKTSIQVMDILKELSKDRLVIMVTHNPELAERYSTRIVRILDGKITGDSSPLTPEEIQRERDAEKEVPKRGERR